MGKDLEDRGVSLHARYAQQARWTADLRSYLFEQARLERARRVLEVGCGTGAVLGTLSHRRSDCQSDLQIYGLDIGYANIVQAQSQAPHARLIQGDGLRLPFPTDSFDIVYCHFLLLWVMDAAQAVAEMRRVTRPGGWVLALAEPDYGGRVDYPEALAEAGRLQAQALRDQGAEPNMGRRLMGLFNRTGMAQINTGVLGGQWRAGDESEWQAEWEVLRSDLGDRLTEAELQRLYRIEATARQNNERVLFVPTFYAAGVKE